VVPTAVIANQIRILMIDRDRYYRIAGRASSMIGRHSGLRYLQKAARRATKILDIGCGEGTRLNLMARNTPGWGVDIDQYAIKLARAKYPRYVFKTYEGILLPFKSSSFDLVYSAFVLEHTTDPERFIKEAIRVIKPGGMLVLLCPNFGAPNRRSPNSTVTPKEEYGQIDDDTTVEPYLLTLRIFLQHLELDVIRASSLWELEPSSFNPRKILFKVLGSLRVFPFRNWGPQIFLVARKPSLY
jgi:SAM-dependent methyltransferase